MTLRLPHSEYRALCYAVLDRDGGKCRSCFSRNNLHVHHITFRSQQGADEADNLITLCSSCHDGVHKDVKDGQYGLVIRHNGEGWVVMSRRPDWKPK
jgi:5-methylcytosine-specific restriction endonuclease McrA